MTSPHTIGRMNLHWSPRSPFVRKVMIAALELGLAERLDLRRSVVRIDMPNAELMTGNPLNKIPTLVLEDGTVLFDSLVICEYLDAIAGGGRLIPASGSSRWSELTRHAMATGLLELLILYRYERDKPEVARTQSWLDAFHAKTEATLAHFERDIAATAATPFGLAQITMGIALAYLDFRFAHLQWRDARPKLATWHAEFSARPAAAATAFRDDS